MSMGCLTGSDNGTDMSMGCLTGSDNGTDMSMGCLLHSTDDHPLFFFPLAGKPPQCPMNSEPEDVGI